jgi:hypothetical protein
MIWPKSVSNSTSLSPLILCLGNCGRERNGKDKTKPILAQFDLLSMDEVQFDAI